MIKLSNFDGLQCHKYCHKQIFLFTMINTFFCIVIYFLFLQAVNLSISSILLVIAAVGTSVTTCLQIYPSFAALSSTHVVEVITRYSLNKTVEQEVTAVIISTINQTFELVTIPIQTYLIITISSDQRAMQHINLNRVKAFWFNACIQFLLMANLIYWINGSFLQFSIQESLPWNDFVFGKPVWAGLVQFALPLLLFFRFHSVHIIVETYVELWLHKSHDEATENPS